MTVVVAVVLVLEEGAVVDDADALLLEDVDVFCRKIRYRCNID